MFMTYPKFEHLRKTNELVQCMNFLSPAQAKFLWVCVTMAKNNQIHTKPWQGVGRDGGIPTAGTGWYQFNSRNKAGKV